MCGLFLHMHCAEVAWCLLDMTGTRGRDKAEFTNLQGISTSSNGRIVVADSNNQCIQVSVCHTLEPQ